MKARTILIGMMICVGMGFSNEVLIWSKNGHGIYESDIQELAINPNNNELVYAATSKGLYKSENGGNDYDFVFQLSGEGKGINDIYIERNDPKKVYVATDDGLYESAENGRSWKKIYLSSDREFQKCHSVVHFGGFVFLGTQKGLFYKSDEQSQWYQFKMGLGDRPVYDIAEAEGSLYLASGNEVFYLGMSLRHARKIFDLGIEKETEGDGGSDENSMDVDDRLVRSLEVFDFGAQFIFIATTNGVYVSYDDAENWELLSDRGLPLEDISSLLILKDMFADHKSSSETPLDQVQIIVGTKKGAFLLSDGKWTPIYRGMETNRINALTKNARGTVYAATDKGIFCLPFKETFPSFEKVQTEDSAVVSDLSLNQGSHPNFDYEPSIDEVHQMAIDYAEVNPVKITAWRQQARKKAWFPDLAVGVDSDRDWSRSDNIWGTYSGGGQLFIGPDDKSRGENIGWDVSLSWNLADLVWSTDQTTIDSRSKLMVELREDILNEITRLYFERRRNQIERAMNMTLDQQLCIDQELRIAELTALIDALTGGEFSQRIEKKRKGLVARVP